MDRIDESRVSFSSDGEGSDSELSPTADSRPAADWNHPNPRSGTIPGGQFELPISTPPLSTATPTQPLQPSPLKERALSATDALFQTSRKRASSEADKTKPVKESGRRTLFSRPAKIMTNLAGGGKDKDKNKTVEKDESPLSPTYFRPFASPSNLRPRHSHDETHRSFSIGNLGLTNSAATTPSETSHAALSPAATATPTTSSSLRPQLFHRTRKDSNPSSALSVSTALSKPNSSEGNLSHSPASPSLFPGMERAQGAMPKGISTQDIRQVNAGHYSGDAVVMDDPWPLLRARGLGLFHGEGMRINIEELNKLVVYVLLPNNLMTEHISVVVCRNDKSI